MCVHVTCDVHPGIPHAAAVVLHSKRRSHLDDQVTTSRCCAIHQDWGHTAMLLASLQPDMVVLHACCCCRGTSLCLAILHPRKLSVCTLQAVGSSYLQLSKLYEHKLEHTAANLAYGPFGGATGAHGAYAQKQVSTSTLLHHLPGIASHLSADTASVCVCVCVQVLTTLLCSPMMAS